MGGTNFFDKASIIVYDLLDKLPDFSYLFDEEVFLVGGVVRDAYLERRITKDVDIASRLNPEDFMERCRKMKVKAFGTGLRHGTVTFKYNGAVYEHTSFRKDVSCDGRNATVEFADSLEEDLSRRDFTINALAYKGGKVYDYFGGLKDLRCRKLRCVGSAQVRFREDYLRIIRACRFASRFCLVVDEGIVDASRVLGRKIKEVVSVERIVDEVNKSRDFLQSFFSYAEELGIFYEILPHYEDSDKERLFGILSGCKKYELSNDMLWTMLYLPVERKLSCNDWCQFFRLSNKIKRFMEGVQFLRDFTRGISEFGKREIKEVFVKVSVSVDNCLSFIRDVLKEDVIQFEGSFSKYKIVVEKCLKEPYVTGKDLMAMGIKPSKDFKLFLEKAQDFQLEGKNKEEIIELIKLCSGK